MNTILYIHGAFASSISFNRIKEKLPEHEAIMLDYTVDDDLRQVIDDCVKKLKESGKHVSIVAHSLGGILGSIIAQKSQLVDLAVTMSTPFGGSKAADVLKWFNPHPMFEHICTSSSLLRSMYSNPAGAPTLSLVTTKGRNPMMNEDNDGVVSIHSQTAWDAPQYVTVPYSHVEVLVADETITKIKEFLFDERLNNDDRSSSIR
jgi:pimeloyl-ACP methyl ester carboxylesterase